MNRMSLVMSPSSDNRSHNCKNLTSYSIKTNFSMNQFETCTGSNHLTFLPFPNFGESLQE